LINRQVRVPLFDQVVPVIADPNADPEKGTGVVMCCTFGDQADVAWWRTHRLPLVEAVGRDGRMTQAAGAYMDMRLEAARTQIKSDLETAGFLLARQPTSQSIRVHERCDTPVEYIIAHQWFIQVLENKAELLRLGERVLWVPDHMQKRYQAWVENLSWDWCISRQRYFGVPFPLWYCQSCGEILLADPAQLPVDPQDDPPPDPCPRCGSASYLPEEDIFDTWATSSMTPQIVGRQGDPAHPGLFERVFPFSLRPQAHEIIRTWAFYTITKSHYQHARLPWQDVLISGWGLAGEGTGKISKSRGGGPMAPLEMIQRYSADAVRYWAASTGPGKDSVIAEEKIQLGAKLVTKLWNVARFSERFIAQDRVSEPENLSPADRWALSRLQKLVRRATELLEAYEYAAAKAEIEAYFWTMADNYLEMAKQRLYDPLAPGHAGARFTLRYLLETLLKLFAPYLPFITEEIYQGLFGAATELRQASLHRQAWPVVQPVYEDNHAEQFGDLLIAIASAVRRYKSERNLSLGTELAGLQLAVNPEQVETLQKAATDLMSICRVRRVELVEALDPGVIRLQGEGNIQIGIEPPPIDINPVKG
jgi:valyl-tRNA synthetase